MKASRSDLFTYLLGWALGSLLGNWIFGPSALGQGALIGAVLGVLFFYISLAEASPDAP